MRTTPAVTTSPTLTSTRVSRLYKLLVLLAAGPHSRKVLLSRLKLDLRSFYRDLETVRQMGIAIVIADNGKYTLTGTLDDALGRLPFPDPGLNVREALQLANGSTAAHRKLRQRVNTFLSPPSTSRKAR